MALSLPISRSRVSPRLCPTPGPSKSGGSDSRKPDKTTCGSDRRRRQLSFPTPKPPNLHCAHEDARVSAVRNCSRHSNRSHSSVEPVSAVLARILKIAEQRLAPDKQRSQTLIWQISYRRLCSRRLNLGNVAGSPTC